MPTQKSWQRVPRVMSRARPASAMDTHLCRCCSDPVGVGFSQRLYQIGLRLPSVSGGAAPYPALLLFSGKEELVKREIPRVHDPNFSAGSDTAYAAAPFEARPQRTAGDADPHSMSSAEVTRQSAFAKLEHCAENLRGNIRQTRQRLSNVLRESDSPPPKISQFPHSQRRTGRLRSPSRRRCLTRRCGTSTSTASFHTVRRIEEHETS